MRVFGSVLLVIACSWLGMQRALRYRKRPRVLLALTDVLTYLKNETCEYHVPLEDALMQAERCTRQLQPFFAALRDGFAGSHAFSWTWEHAVLSLSLLNDEDKSPLLLLGEQLGRYDDQTQSEMISRCIETLRAHATAAQGQAYTNGKLSVGLGVASGILIAVTLY